MVEGEISQCKNDLSNSKEELFVGKKPTENRGSFRVGGISGYIIASKVSNCFNNETVIGNWCEAGLIGECNGTLEYSYNLGKVKGMGTMEESGNFDPSYLTAGLIGLTTKEEYIITNWSVESYNEDGSDIVLTKDGNKKLIESKDVNIDGQNKKVYVFSVSDYKKYNVATTLNRCYNVGLVTADGYGVAGLIGEYNGCKVINSYYENTTNENWVVDINDDTGYSIDIQTESKLSKETIQSENFVTSLLGGIPFKYVQNSYPKLEWEN